MPKSPCRCATPDRTLWRIVTYKGNRSAFSGGRFTSSSYSQLRCMKCGWYWRTKGRYVREIAFAKDDEAYRNAEVDGGLKAESRVRSVVVE